MIRIVNGIFSFIDNIFDKKESLNILKMNYNE